MSVKMKYCAKCGDYGIDLNGNPCSCRAKASIFYEAVSCLDIPTAYRGVMFNKLLVPKDCGADYAEFLANVYTKVTDLQWRSHNLVIASPVQHSKTVMAYSCIEMLFRAGVGVYPIYDVLELYKAMVDADLGRKTVGDILEPENIALVNVLFVKIPRVSDWKLYDAISLLLDRRVRRGNSTIFLYDGTWSQLIYNDKMNTLKGLMGDGNFGTLEVKSWDLLTSKQDVQLQENIG